MEAYMKLKRALLSKRAAKNKQQHAAKKYKIKSINVKRRYHYIIEYFEQISQKRISYREIFNFIEGLRRADV